ncbi:DUF4157 domain-containing protein [Micromonospora sp. NPDC093277]|uniref:eCIS core domain-containing protein n=1 Tax=Micromonospora sp. NPDC093277 TaxID=3364291 RepID=UPI003819A886
MPEFDHATHPRTVSHEELEPTGRPLAPDLRADLERGLRHDLGHIRVHDDATSGASARDVEARALTVGAHIVLAPGQVDTDLPAGRAVLAHEAWHSLQQAGHAGSGTATPGHERQADAAAASVLTGAAPPAVTPAPVAVQRQGSGEVRLAEHKAEVLARRPIKYTEARAANERYARGFGFATALATAGGGRFAQLGTLWNKGAYDAFADAVASLQFDFNLPERDIDGILGPTTWWRIAGLGEAMAAIQKVTNPDSERLCYLATKERLLRGTQLATGGPLSLPEGATKPVFETILATHEWKMDDVPQVYRGTGAAGALVYAGLGEFVAEADVWNGGLKPGAAMQVWRSRAAYDLLQVGRVTLKGGRTRAIRSDDADFFGTSFVFVRYEGDKMVVRHFGGTETHKKSDFAVWIAANAK